MTLMRSRLMCPHCQRGVEKQNSLIRPSSQIPTSQRYVKSQVAVYLLDDIHQRRRHLHSLRDTEAESMRLPRLMIRVLSQNHHLHLVERGAVEGGEDVATLRIAGVLGSLLDKEFLELGKVWRLKLRFEDLQPRLLYFWGQGHV